MAFDQKNNHYLNEKNRIFPKSEPDNWDIMDADYNIKTGNTFGETQERTLWLQGWRGEQR